jgi:UDP-N-acetylglucosamine 2-epimerase (non-hydrolysing)
LAAALAAVKLGIPIAHVEAGLRSFDRSMPEEINRLLTDAIADHLFVTEESGRRNLLREGKDASQIFFVGNVMIDTLVWARPLWERSDAIDRLGLTRGRYVVATIHRPSNVDNQAALGGLMGALSEVAREVPVVFPIHPRTRTQLPALADRQEQYWFGQGSPPGRGIYCLAPIGYLDFMCLVAGARLVLTDSGGLQEETTFLGVPCLTLRSNTERPVTVTHGTNRVIGCSPRRIVEEAFAIFRSPVVGTPQPPPLWDGRTAGRIVNILLERLNRNGELVARALSTSTDLRRSEALQCSRTPVP